MKTEKTALLRDIPFMITALFSLFLGLFILLVPAEAGLGTTQMTAREILLCQIRNLGAVPLLFGTLAEAVLLFHRLRGHCPRLHRYMRIVCMILAILMSALGGYFVYGLCSFTYYSPIMLSLHLGNHPYLISLWWISTAIMCFFALPPKEPHKPE